MFWLLYFGKLGGTVWDISVFWKGNSGSSGLYVSRFISAPVNAVVLWARAQGCAFARTGPYKGALLRAPDRNATKHSGCAIRTASMSPPPQSGQRAAPHSPAWPGAARHPGPPVRGTCGGAPTAVPGHSGCAPGGAAAAEPRPRIPAGVRTPNPNAPRGAFL